MTAIEVGHGSPKPNPTNTGDGKKKSNRRLWFGFGFRFRCHHKLSVSLFLPVGDRISSPREGWRARERERVAELNAGK